MKYYIKATGSTCYDKTGITYPENKTIDLETLVNSHGGFNCVWQNQFGWSNQPQVLTFEMDDNSLDYQGLKEQASLKIQNIENEIYRLGLLICLHWQHIVKI